MVAALAGWTDSGGIAYSLRLESVAMLPVSPSSCASIRCCDLGSLTPGRERGLKPEEPAAENLHGGVSEGGEQIEPWWT